MAAELQDCIYVLTLTSGLVPYGPSIFFFFGLPAALPAATQSTFAVPPAATKNFLAGNLVRSIEHVSFSAEGHCATLER